RLGIRSRIHRFLWLRVEYDAAVSQLADGFLDARFLQELGVRLGQFQLPFLRTYLFSDANLAFIDRPLYVPQTFDRQALRYLGPRDVGVMLSGRVGDTRPEGNLPVFEYWAGMLVGQGPGLTGNVDNAYEYFARAGVHVFGVPLGVENESDLARNEVPRLNV